MDRGEGRDGAEAVEWIAAQQWCDGNVGMFGMSYGGISSLKVAFEQPPHLKAIVPIMGTDDIYVDYLYSGDA
jgi:putative CocE/NonD family hydrolase